MGMMTHRGRFFWEHIMKLGENAEHMRRPTFYLLLTAGLCALIATITFGYFTSQNGGALVIGSDFDRQQMPFTMALNNQIKRGGLTGWMWNLDLGSGLIPSFTFYELGSPFFWLSLAFPAARFPYVVAWIYVAKYVVAGVTAHLYLRTFLHDEAHATFGAVLYAFSGFQTTNLLFYHFHDVVAVFPLLVLGLDRFVQDRRKWRLFVVAAFLNCLVNYFFFVQSVIFLVLYYLVRYAPRWPQMGVADAVGEVGACLACGALGVGMAGVLFVPSVLSVIELPRAEDTMLILSNVVWGARKFLFMLKGFLLPGEAMSNNSAIIVHEYSSFGCWLPFVGLSLVIAYMRTESGWLRQLLILLMIASLSPLLCASFLLFTAIYVRWWYFLVLMMALASALAIEQVPEPIIRGSALWVLIATCVFALVLWFVPFGYDGEILVTNREAFLTSVGVAVVGPLALLVRPQLANGRLMWLTTATCVTAAVSMGLTIESYRSAWEGRLGQVTATQQYWVLSQALEPYNEQYRYVLEDNRLTLAGGVAGTSSFSSTVSAPLFEFDRLFDGSSQVFRREKDIFSGAGQLLGSKYIIYEGEEVVCGVNAEHDFTVAQDFERTWIASVEAGGRTYDIYEREACPIGYAVWTYITRDELMQLPVEQRGLAMLQAVVVDSDAEAEASQYLEHVDVWELDYESPVDDLVRDAAVWPAWDFVRDDHGFSCTASVGTYYFSIPNDRGWHIYIDGVETKPIDSCGMMLIVVPEGTHEVRGVYETPGLTIGVAASCAGFVLFALACVMLRGDASDDYHDRVDEPYEPYEPTKALHFAR